MEEGQMVPNHYKLILRPISFNFANLIFKFICDLLKYSWSVSFMCFWRVEDGQIVQVSKNWYCILYPLTFNFIFKFLYKLLHIVMVFLYLLTLCLCTLNLFSSFKLFSRICKNTIHASLVLP